MSGKYFSLAFVLILAVTAPAAGSLTKISAGAPVYIGEQNLDISSGLQGCRNIAWWAPGADTDAPPQKNISIIKTLDDSGVAFSYTIKPELFTGYEGTWYCEGQRPLRSVFEVKKPGLSVKFWDLDTDEDITGQTISLTSNISFRIDTNLDKALQWKYRPDWTPHDSFFTVSLKDPADQVLFSIYTGSYGKAGSQGLLFDRNPLISSSPYVWKDGSVWDRTSKNKQGDPIYPPGTYTVTVNQNLNKMAEMWAATTPENRAGVLDASAAITFIKPVSTPVEAATPSGTVTTVSVGTTASPLTYATLPPSQTEVPTKTTYSPLPFWVVLAALGTALACGVWQRN